MNTLDLNNSQQEQMAQLLEKQKQLAAEQNKKVESQPSVEEQKVEPKSTEEQSKPEAEVAPKETQEEVKAEEKSDEISSWDADETLAQVKEPLKFDFGKLGSALDLGEIKDENELVTKVSELRNRNKQLEANPLEGVPEEFREVLKVTKSGEDWKRYLAESVVDYNKVDPIKLYEDQFFEQAVKLPKFRNQDGSVNQQAILDALDQIPEVSRAIEGSRLQQSLMANQQARKAQIVNQAQEKIANADKALSKAANSLNELLPFENYGIKFEPKHSSQIYEGVTSSKLTKKHLGISYEDLVRSGADMKQVARTIASAEYSESMIKFKAKNSQVQAKRELLEKVQNVQLNSAGTRVQPDSDEKQKVMTPAEKMKYHLEEQKKKTGFR